MAKLTKYEKETIILFNEGEDTASIYTFNAGLKKRLAIFAKKYPDFCRQEKTHEQNGVSYVLDRIMRRLGCIYNQNAASAPAFLTVSV